ncbi:hypothetical protein DKX38_008655 [Salix brachista]|uniref:Uncharacterized protein n=1 Tax=Salix brachista TaxID=2182728 RepID=A0A5N5MTI8_9ROSI|nr:hypothetical protein DKX38_008655 [Salix brachista]
MATSVSMEASTGTYLVPLPVTYVRTTKDTSEILNRIGCLLRKNLKKETLKSLKGMKGKSDISNVDHSIMVVVEAFDPDKGSASEHTYQLIKKAKPILNLSQPI